nr:lysophospholipid acyltransferase family protein [Nocardioides daphniae]
MVREPGDAAGRPGRHQGCADQPRHRAVGPRPGRGVRDLPEGTRSRDGRLYRGRTGVAHLALTAGVPVVPVGLRGTEQIQPVGATLPRLAKVRVAFGEPLDFTGLVGTAPLGRLRREVTDTIMREIQLLSGQEEAGAYNERPVDA